MIDKQIEPGHIGIVIKEELIDAYEVTVFTISKETGIPVDALNNLLDGDLALSSDMALKLGKYFNIDPKYLLNVQTEFEVRKKERELSSVLCEIQPLEIA